MKRAIAILLFSVSCVSGCAIKSLDVAQERVVDSMCEADRTFAAAADKLCEVYADTGSKLVASRREIVDGQYRQFLTMHTSADGKRFVSLDKDGHEVGVQLAEVAAEFSAYETKQGEIRTLAASIGRVASGFHDAIVLQKATIERVAEGNASVADIRKSWQASLTAGMQMAGTAAGAGVAVLFGL